MSIDEMARESGVARATLYYYFAGKDDLVAFLLDDKVASSAEAMDKALAFEGSVVERLERLVFAIFDSMARQPALCLEMPNAMRNPDHFGEALEHAEEIVLAPLQRLLTEGVRSGELRIDDVPAAMTFMQGAIWQMAWVKLLDEGSLDSQQLAEAAMPLLKGALGAAS